MSSNDPIGVINNGDPTINSNSAPAPSAPASSAPASSAPTSSSFNPSTLLAAMTATPNIEADKVSSIKYPTPYLWFLFLICICIGFFVVIEWGSNLSDIKQNWPEYRCQPHMMPFASFFGQDINENFQFCLNQIIQENTKGITGPFAGGMFGFTTVLTNLMESANSFRTMLATLVGGVIKIVGEFKSRMTALMGRIKLTASRMKAMMFRIYGTMFAVIYMGLSAQTGIANFGDTFIFKFIDTFCFPPEQPITLESGEVVPIAYVTVGDVLIGGHRVETTYSFMADGQDMVRLNGVEVSSNHLVSSNGLWIMAKDHPDARPTHPWNGGAARPLICLSTHDHIIDIGSYIFADYDETELGNYATQKMVHSALNGLSRDKPYKETSYEVGVNMYNTIKTLSGYSRLFDIQLGDMLTETAKVVGILVSETNEVCILPGGTQVAAGTLLWNKETSQWLRACTIYPIRKLARPIDIIALFVSPGASYELKDGTIIRDAMEVYSPDTKKAYTDLLIGKPIEI